MTERPRIAQREPRSLQPEQLGKLTVCTPAAPHSVHAWILWEDGVEELVQAHATPGPGGAFESALACHLISMRFGVWAGAVERG
jgi:hypothetical protein